LKILLVISSPLYYRNYLQSGALAALSANDCFLAVADTVAADPETNAFGNHVGSFKYSKARITLYVQAFTILTRRYRHLSRTFAYRFNRLYGVWSQPCRTPLGRFRRLALNLAFRLGGSRLLAPLVLAALRRLIPANEELAAIIDNLKPDVVVIPTGLMDPVANDVVRICRPRNIKTLFLVDNWDGMISKTIMWDRPDYVGAWGEQTRLYATSIHGIAPERSFAIGTPRFEAYYEGRGVAPRIYDFPYVLFCGSAVPFDELSVLNMLDAEISANRDIYGDLKIVYRPHPWRHKRWCKDMFVEGEYGNVVLDKQVAENYYNPRGTRFQPDLGYYVTLLYDAGMVVGPPTSMTVEALICGRQVLTLAFDDEIHIESPYHTYRNYLNLEGIDAIVGNALVLEKGDLARQFRETFVRPSKPTAEQIRQSLDHFLVQGQGGYGERLKAVLARIAENASGPSGSAMAPELQSEKPLQGKE